MATKLNPPRQKVQIVQEETENQNAQFMIQYLKSRIDNCQFKTEEEKQKFMGLIEDQKTRIEDLQKIQDSRAKNVSEAESENVKLNQELQHAKKILEELNTHMMDTRSVCMQLKEMCTPMATGLITCVKYKEHVLSFQKEMTLKVTEVKETISSLKNKCDQRKMNWKKQADHLKMMKEMQKREAQEVVEKMRNDKDEVKVKRVTKNLKNDAIEQRLNEKKAEKEVVINNLKQEQQQIRELMLKEKKKNEELNALTEQHNKNVLNLESALQDVNNETDLQKNKLLNLKQKIANGSEEYKTSEVELVSVKSKTVYLDAKKEKIEKVLQENNSIEMKLTSELEKTKEEFDGMKQAHSNIADSYSKKQEETSVLKVEIQEKQVQQETLVSENAMKIEDISKQMQDKKSELLNVGSILNEDKETVTKLHRTITENEVSISSVKQQMEILHNEIAENKKDRESCESLAKELSENNKKTTEELQCAQSTLHELQESLSSVKLKSEEFQIHSAREKRELEQELLNVRREQQNSANNSEWIIQQTETCVEACKQNYAQHVKEKEVMLAALKNEAESLNKDMENATAINDQLACEKKEKKNSFEDTIKMLELELANKKMRAITMGAEEDLDKQPALGIPTSTGLEKLKSKRVHFHGLSSDSEASLLDAETLMTKTKHHKMMSDSASFSRKRDSKKDTSKKFFKQRTSTSLKDNAKKLKFSDFDLK